MDRERLLARRTEHWQEGAYCRTCQRQYDDEIGLWPCEQSVILDLALEAERLRGQLQRSRQHAKGIVQGGTPKEIAESILAEHLDEVPRGAHRDKLDDELCRVCALASMIMNAESEAELRRWNGLTFEELGAEVERLREQDEAWEEQDIEQTARITALEGEAERLRDEMDRLSLAIVQLFTPQVFDRIVARRSALAGTEESHD